MNSEKTISIQAQNLVSGVDPAKLELSREDRFRELVKVAGDCSQGTEFLDSMVRDLAQLFDVEWLFIGKVHKSDSIICTESLYSSKEDCDQLCYEWKNTPCEKILNGEEVLIESGVGNEYPQSKGMQSWGIESFAGVPLIDFEGNICGVVIAMDSRARRDLEEVQDAIKLLSARCAQELNRVEAVESQRRFTALFNSAGQAMAITDAHSFEYLEVNQAWHEMFGYTPDEIQNMTFFDITHPEDIEISRSRTKSLCSNEINDFRIEKKYLNKEGKTVHALTSVNRVRMSNGKEVNVAVITDITQRVKAKDELGRMDSLFKSIFDNAPLGMAITNQEGTILEGNSGFFEIFASNPEEVVGQSIIKFHSDPDYSLENCMCQAVLQSEKEFVRKEELFLNSQQKPVWLEHSISSFEKSESDNLLLHMFLDIEARKKNEMILLDGLEKLRLVFEHANHCIGFTNREGDVISLNPTFLKLLGYSEGEQIEFNFRDVTPEEFLLKELPLCQEICDGKSQGYRLEKQLICKDGSRVWIDISIAGVRNNEGEIEHFVGVASEISKRKELESKLRSAVQRADSANIAKSQFLARMSHEIRTPIHTIIGTADLLEETKLDDEQKRYVQTFSKASNSLLNLLNDILDLSKIEAGELVLEDVVYSPKEVLQEVKVVLGDQALQKGNRLQYTLEGQVADYVLGDRQRIYQILTNLCSNAIKFTNNGMIYLQLEANQEKLIFSVIDTGIGIEESKLKNIFDPFVQADSSFTRIYGGSGLGLSICKQLVEAMGGTIEVNSNPGSGSVFRFSVPYLEALAPDMIDLIHSEYKSKVESKRILLVEDTLDSQMIVQAFLKDENHSIHLANNGLEAIRAYQEQDFDLILMDIQMPLMDGLEATRKIRQWERETGKSRCPVVALTANAMRGDANESYNAGCDQHLTKPLRKKRLLELIKEI